MRINVSILIKAVTVSAFLIGCNDFSPREYCIKNKCKNAIGECYLGMTVLNSLFFSTPYSSTTTPYETAYSESSYTNDTFYNAGSFSLSGSYSIYNYSGSISTSSDVDIFYAYVYSSSGSYGGGSGTYKFTKTSGSASCALYTSITSQSSNTTATPASSMTSRGTLSTTAISVTLDLGDYVYIVCTGNLGDTYRFRNEYVQSSSITSTSSYSSSFQDIMNSLTLISCMSAKDDCITECIKKNRNY